MKKLSFFICSIVVFGLIASANADEELKVVGTLSTYSSLAETIGGDAVETSSVASPRFNPHYIEARPSDILRMKRADLFIHSGLDLEAWRGPLLDAVARADLRNGGARQLDLSLGIPLLEVPSGQVSRSEGDIHQFGNPHYWTDPRNGLIIAQAIESKLVELLPEREAQFKKNLHDFRSQLEGKIVEWRAMIAPFRGAPVVSYHNEWPYLLNFLGLKPELFVEPKPGIPPGPQQLENLVAQIRSGDVKVLLQATYSPEKAGEYLSEKTKITVLSLCQNVGEREECPDYISMLDFDVRSLVKALS
ncbi:MAG: zinc ABC transporter substrate-binding protein [Bdellovibrionales bacterium]|nr:zinc ABC transporter substrate-binding protein [Bdellovibrionales bacterium]